MRNKKMSAGTGQALSGQGRIVFTDVRMRADMV